MKESNPFNLSVQEIKKPGSEIYEYHIDNKFFKELNYDEYEDVSIKINLTKKNENKTIELQLHLKGWVELHCDLSYDLFKLPIEIATRYLIKFDENTEYQDDIISILTGETSLNLAPHLYELVLLSIPMKRIHPDIANGIRKKPNFANLNDSPFAGDFLERKIKVSDPRWDQLKKLVDNKKINNHGTSKEEDIQN